MILPTKIRLVGSVSESMGDLDGAMVAYERAFQHNSYSVPALMAISGILRAREQFGRAAEFLQTVTRLDNTNGEMWSNLGEAPILDFSKQSSSDPLLGHCYLMMDDLQSAYQAYQQALYHLRDPKVGSELQTPQKVPY